ncbi:hypothetical protein V2J09_012588 [Rumex salicifolius]
MAGDNCADDLSNEENGCEILSSEGVEFLLSAEGKVMPLPSSYGKRVCLYFAANWCRPCKSVTSKLMQIYKALNKDGDQKLEIIFVSSDCDENEFREHFKSMPWLAVPFDTNLNRWLSRRCSVDQIPSFVPLTMDGFSAEENAVDLIEDYGLDAFPFTVKRREELKAVDNAKRCGVKVEMLLAHDQRDYLVSRDGRKISVSDLIGKTIGLFFGAFWCPPARNFNLQLTDTYKILTNTKKLPFEVVFVSMDRDHDEFQCSLTTMPWLAIPYEDKTRHDLGRIFEVKKIPALVIIGPDGKTVNTNGRDLVSSYDALAFPFTDSRVKEIEAAVREEGERLPQKLRDRKHEHVLKLDMAKAYVCDACRSRGKFWTFSCDVCDYDLHPSCVEEEEEEEIM